MQQVRTHLSNQDKSVFVILRQFTVTNAQVSTEAIKNPLLVENQEAAVELITLPARETVTMVMAPVVPREIANVEVKNIGEKMLVVIKKEDTPIPVVPNEIANVEVKNLGEKTVVVIKKEDTPVQQEIANEEVKNPEEKTAVVSKKKEGLRRRRVINVDWDTLVDIVADILDEEGLLNDDVDADLGRFYYNF